MRTLYLFDCSDAKHAGSWGEIQVLVLVEVAMLLLPAVETKQYFEIEA